jgi:hypothetical protein
LPVMSTERGSAVAPRRLSTPYFAFESGADRESGERGAHYGEGQDARHHEIDAWAAE